MENPRKKLNIPKGRTWCGPWCASIHLVIVYYTSRKNT